jgi:hypothetical protein
MRLLRRSRRPRVFADARSLLLRTSAFGFASAPSAKAEGASFASEVSEPRLETCSAEYKQRRKTQPLAGAPSAHLDVSGRAPAVNPQGVDRRRHAAAGAKPCVRMELPTPRHRSSVISPQQNLRMPICWKCLHRGEDHNWRVPECSVCGRTDPACGNCARNLELRRVRGACLSSGSERRCICSKYVPSSDERRPVNDFAGRVLSQKRR